MIEQMGPHKIKPTEKEELPTVIFGKETIIPKMKTPRA